ncbi:PBPRA1643 family SWIM/SEC-C metal-binding motif protein [Paraglaciecola aestuariivivens]
MSKFFFKGRIDPREQYQRFGYNPNRQVKLGTAAMPLSLVVNSVQREQEIQRLLEQHSLVAKIEIDSEQPEDIAQLQAILNTPTTHNKTQQPNRNAPCTCGSGLKFKKCCAK